MSETLKVTINNALKAYKEADQKGKAMLENLYGKNVFSFDIKDRVKTFEDACEVVGANPNDDKFKEGDPDDIAYQKIKVICRALNEDWEADWANDNQYKYVPWFKHTSGLGFSYYDCGLWFTFTDVGSRLCFKSRELCEYAAKQFAPIYSDFLL